MYTFESRIRYSECDEEGRLDTLALVNYLQDCSTFHSESIGRGVGYMRDHGLAWFIAAWQIEVLALPCFMDRICVQTWCYEMGRTLARRNFVMCDDQDQVLVRADSLWFVYDTAKGRAVRIGPEQQVYLSGEERLDMPATKRRLRVEGPATAAASLVVSEIHLDSNHHVNNAQYLRMALHAVQAASTQGMPTPTAEGLRIGVQYCQQAHLGDVIVPHMYTVPPVTTVSLDDESGSPYAVVRLEPLT